MSNGKKSLAGFVVALLIGGGGGYALGPIADTMAGYDGPAMTTAIGARRMRIDHIRGNVQLLAPDGGWRPTAVGEASALPTGFATDGLSSLVVAKLGTQELHVGRGARMLVGDDTGRSVTFQLDGGHVLVRNGRGTTFVPSRAMRVVGTDYGVWAEDERVVVAVLGGEVEVTYRGETTKFAKGREIVYTRKSVVPRAMEQKLALNVVTESTRGRKKRMTLQTSPAAFVFLKKNNDYEAVTVASSGRFDVTLAGTEPGAGELVAFDAAGRIAALGEDSPEELKSMLGGGVAVPAVVDEQPKAEEEMKTKVGRPEPLEKPEAKLPKLDDMHAPQLDLSKKEKAEPEKVEKRAQPKKIEKKAEPKKKPVEVAPPPEPKKAEPEKKAEQEKKAEPEKKAPPDVPDEDPEDEISDDEF